MNAVAGVGRIERNVSPAGFENAEQGDDHFQGSLETNADPNRSHPTHATGQPIGSLAHLAPRS